jgi:hypothetical protein
VELAAGDLDAAVARSLWLSRQEVYDSGAYEQVARVFREHGYLHEAEEILIAQRKQAASRPGSRQGFPRRAVRTVYSVSVGYGYRPERVLWLIAALLIAVIASLEIPASQSTLRATTQAGVTYTVDGPLPPSLRQAPEIGQLPG